MAGREHRPAVDGAQPRPVLDGLVRSLLLSGASGGRAGPGRLDDPRSLHEGAQLLGGELAGPAQQEHPLEDRLDVVERLPRKNVAHDVAAGVVVVHGGQERQARPATRFEEMVERREERGLQWLVHRAVDHGRSIRIPAGRFP
jgi:hypothetical protein